MFEIQKDSEGLSPKKNVQTPFYFEMTVQGIFCLYTMRVLRQLYAFIEMGSVESQV